MPFVTINERTIYRDGTFARGAHPPAASVREAERYLDPAFRHLPPAEPAALPPALRWLIGDDSPPELAERLTRAFHAGRLLIGRACSDRLDPRTGDVTLMSGLPAVTQVPVLHRHHDDRVRFGHAGIFRRAHDAIAAVVLEDDRAGPAPGCSIGGTARAWTQMTGWKLITAFEPTDVVLTDNPIDPTCRAVALNDSRFDEFATRVLGLGRKDFPWLSK